MMDDIKIGDLVMLVRSHCENEYLGRVFRVESISQELSSCRTCGKDLGSPMLAFGEIIAALSWLRKIPPLSREDSIGTTTDHQMDIKV